MSRYHGRSKVHTFSTHARSLTLQQMPRHLTRDTIPAATLERLEKAFGHAVSAAEAAQAAGATIDPIHFVGEHLCNPKAPEPRSNTSFIMDAAIVKTLEVELGDALTAWVNGKEATHEPLQFVGNRLIDTAATTAGGNLLTRLLTDAAEPCAAL